MELTRELLAGLDGVVIATAHREKVDYRAILQHAPLVLDTKNVVASVLGLDELPRNLFRL